MDDGKGADVTFDELIHTTWEHWMQNTPEWATQVGYPGQNDRWSDCSISAIEQRKEEDKTLLTHIQAIDPLLLDKPSRLSYHLFKKQVEERIEETQFETEYLPITQLWGVQKSVPDILRIMPRDTTEGYEDILSRLEHLPQLIQQTIDLLEDGVARGITPPQIVLKGVPQQIECLLELEPSKNPLLVPFFPFPNRVPKRKQSVFLKTATELLQKKLHRAYQRLHTTLTQTYIPSSRESIAIREAKRGEEWYPFLIRRHTSSRSTPEEIYAMGESEVERIWVEMKKVVTEVGFGGDLFAFLPFMRQNPSFYFAKGEDLLNAYKQASQKADKALPKLFKTLPALSYDVIATPPYSAHSETAYYQPGALALGRPGHFVVNTYNLHARPQWEVEVLTLHETVPGHHLQISVAQGLSHLPEFRKYGEYTAFIEGWGLYAEGLGEEMGFYTNPYSRFGRLMYEIFRASRLVVDTGLHWLGWSKERAMGFLGRYTSMTDWEIELEVDRYIAMPAQALAYKMGELKFKELRGYAQQMLTDRFDLRAFHDQLLNKGALPMDLLEDTIREWVTQTLHNHKEGIEEQFLQGTL